MGHEGNIAAEDREGGDPTVIVPPGGGRVGEQGGDSIGPYRLLSVIGEGGFGTVWLAERRVPYVQRVALKIIKPGMDSRAVIARFEQERQALAVMDHPNVARVLDGGITTLGRPYFVMELVRGEPITEFCDKHRMTIRERLELFIPVCEAVQHAHMKGIIHRDIKPGNILVTFVDTGRMSGAGSGARDAPQERSPGTAHGAMVKVIDFGVAKAISHALTDKTIFTEHGQIIGTPEYMSPEQAEMGAVDIDTRTDVYSLGVVLYELLTGALPFDAKALRSKGYNEIQRILREVEPPRPSTRLTATNTVWADSAHCRRMGRDDLLRELSGELEWVPLRALRKDRRERYQSAVALAEDLGRYVRGEPLEAGPESRWYRLRKFVRRNRVLVTAAGAVIVALSAGIVGTGWGLVSAAQKRMVAEANAAMVRYNAYVANVQMAGAWMELRRFDRARDRLEACPEDLRGWEWGWLNAASSGSGRSLPLISRDGSILCAVFSPDARWIATGLDDGVALVSDAATGAPVKELRGHSDRVTSLVFTADGRRIATASRDTTVRVWDAATGDSVVLLSGHSAGVTSVAFSPDAARIVTGSGDGTARVWNAATGATLHVLRGHEGGVTGAAFSPDGTRVVTVSQDGTARGWDVATGRSDLTFVGHQSGVNAVAYSPDGQWIVTASDDKTARVWDAHTAACLFTLKGHTDALSSASFGVHGSRIVTASVDGTAQVWDAHTGASLAELEGHKSTVSSAVFSADDTRILTASADGTARVWDSRPYVAPAASGAANGPAEETTSSAGARTPAAPAPATGGSR